MVSIKAPDGWSGLQLQHLTTLLAVVELGSFTAAADALGYTQSAVSQQVAALERIVGHRVFERPGGPRPVVVTEAGAVLAAHGRAVLDRLHAAHADIRAFADGDAGVVRVGAYQSVGARIVPAVLSRFAAERPRATATLVESSDDAELLRGLERGELDLAFVMDGGETDDEQWAKEHLMDDPLVLLAPAGSGYSPDRPVAVDDLVGRPLIGHRLTVCQIRIEQTLRAAGVEPRVVHRSNDNLTVQRLVGAGIGVAIVPVLTVEVDDPDVVVCTVWPPIPPRRICIVRRRDRRPSPLVTHFVETVREVCADLTERLRPVHEPREHPRAS